MNCHLITGQKPTQVLKGVVTDKETRNPLPGANVIILNSNPLIGTITNAEGKFRLPVEIGRVSVRVSFIGYEDIVIKDEFNGVKKIIDQLPEETKKMLYLRFYGGLKFREIAEVVNITENTVKSTISRAIKKIKKNYEHSLRGDVSG